MENLRASQKEFKLKDPIEVKVEVDAFNEGQFATEETIFLFVHDVVARVARPLLELKAWTKVTLAPGQTKTVAFVLAAECFCFLDENFELLVEQGAFDILVGLNADRKSLLTIRLRALAG